MECEFSLYQLQLIVLYSQCFCFLRIFRFLLATLYVHSLRGVRRRDRRSALRNLDAPSPEDKNISDTDMAYRKVMDRISRQEESRVRFAVEILIWMIFTKDPLTLAELRHALVIRQGDERIDQQDLDDASHIDHACGGLISVDVSRNSVCLIHSTARHFLHRNLYKLASQHESELMESPDGEKISEFESQSNKTIALACIAYLRMEEFKTVTLKSLDHWNERCGAYPFYEYAADFWRQHATDGGLADDDPIILDFNQDTRAIEAMHSIILPLDAKGDPPGVKTFPEDTMPYNANIAWMHPWLDEQVRLQRYIPFPSHGYYGAPLAPVATKIPGQLKGFLQSFPGFIADCENSPSHKTCAQPIVRGPRKFIRLVDLSTMSVVTAVRPWGLKFAALSWKWGDNLTIKLTRTNRAYMESKLPQDYIPPTLADAFQICREIGLRYIWVDTLCIVQDSVEDKESMYPLALDILRHAHIIIVTSSSLNANDGIFKWVTLHEDLGQLFHLTQDSDDGEGTEGQYLDQGALFKSAILNTLIGSSEWALESSIFSRRLLLFTWAGPVLLCFDYLYSLFGSTQVSREDIGYPKSLDHLPRGKQLEGYLKIVRASSNLTQFFGMGPSVALQFDTARPNTWWTTIVKPLGDKMDGQPNQFLFGVPTCAILQLLSWRCYKHEPDSREEKFPSWSWLGWPSVYPHFPDQLIVQFRERSMDPRRCQLRSGDPLTEWNYSSEGKVLQLTTIRVQLRIGEIEYRSPKPDNALFVVLSYMNNELIGHIELDKIWRSKKPPAMDFIPSFIEKDDHGGSRVRMLMCIEPCEAFDEDNDETKGKTYFERVQIMDCDISEEEWFAMAGKRDAKDIVLLR